MKHEYQLYRQTTNALYVPQSLSYLNTLASTTYWKAFSTLFKNLSLVGNDQGAIGLSRIIIWTLNFCNCVHVDSKDVVHPELMKSAKELANTIIRSDHTSPGERKSLINFLSFVDDFNLCVPTTCCYQFVPT